MRPFLLIVAGIALTSCGVARDPIPTFRYNGSTACANAWLLGFGESGNERLIVDIDMPRLGLLFGQGTMVELPHDAVKVHVDTSNRYQLADCGDVIFKPTGPPTRWPATSGKVHLISSALPNDFIMATHDYYISAEIDDLVVRGPRGETVTAPRQIVLFGIAGSGPGG